MPTSPPVASPLPSAALSKSPPLTPLITNTQLQRKVSNHRPTSLASRRVSSYSSNRSVPPISRPESTVLPVFPSSLDYALVRDFAYPWTHPMHYGGNPEDSAPTPASDSRRMSDPSVATWEDPKSSWSRPARWTTDLASNSSTRDQLPARAFNDGGPPYSEDEDLQSPVVRTSRHKKHKSERGRSPGAAGPHRGVIVGKHGNQIEEYHPIAGQGNELDGPGGEIETYTTTSKSYAHRQAKHRDSNFAKPLQRNTSPAEDSDADNRSDDEYSGEDETRYSKDYQFSIASPDEEMHGKAVALFDFASEHQNELPLREGQIILVSYRHGQGWLVAEDPTTGESGLVPEAFVRLVKLIEGGLHGLNSLEATDDEETADDTEREPLSAVTNEPASAVTPTAPATSDRFANSGGGGPGGGGSAGSGPVNEKDKDRHARRESRQQQPAVQSTFSTHTRDFSPRPRTGTNTSTGTGAGTKDEPSRSTTQLQQSS